jgi:glucose dehydrogenase
MSMDEPIRARGPSEPPSTDAAEAFAGYLDELHWLCNAATPGPWTLDESGDGVVAANGNPIAETWGGTRRLDDARFIAAARYALPRLIAELRWLRWLSGGGHV